jgi:hypothetical protein
MLPKMAATRLKSKKPISPQLRAPTIVSVNAVASIILFPIFNPPFVLVFAILYNSYLKK